MESWDEIRTWRRAQRARLLSRRLVVPCSERHCVKSAVTALIREQIAKLRMTDVAVYWPFKGEIDLRAVVGHFVANGVEVSLPVVVQRQQPLEFWAWHPAIKLRRGIWNIPIPVERHVVSPNALFVPLLGFDRAGYRLGYGGGYYDRTLATFDAKPLTIGVGYELGRLDTIYPQWHDIPMDVIVTETRWVWLGDSRQVL